MEEVKFSKSDAEKEDARNGSAAATDDDKPVSVHGSSRKMSGATRRSSKANWTEEEDNILRDAVQKYEGKSWKKIAGCLPGRTDVQCLHRWQKVLNPDVVKGPWSKEEDSILIELVERFGEKKWSEIAEQLPGRMGKQCRERWYNHLKPEINKAAWSDEEERILINAHAEYGNKWSVLANLLPGRTENSVKNHWNCSLKKRLCNYLACGSVASHPRLSVPPPQANSRRAARDPTEANQTPSTTGLVSVSNGEDLIRPRRDSDDNLESSSEWSYTGICYEPFQRVDLEIFLSTGRFPSTESYIREQPRSRRDVKELPCDAYSRARAILRSAAMSYRNVPSIIRKRAIQLLQGGSSAQYNDVAVRGKQVIKVDDNGDDDDRVHSYTFLSQSLRSLQPLNMWRFEGEFGDA